MVRFLKIEKSLGESFELLSFVHFFHCFEKVKQYENGSNGHLLTYDFFEREEGKAGLRQRFIANANRLNSLHGSNGLSLLLVG